MGKEIEVIIMTTENNSTESTTQEKATDVTNKSEVQATEFSLDEFKTLQSNYKSAVSSRDKFKQQVRELEDSVSSATEIKTKYEDLMKQFETVTSELTFINEGQKQKALDSALTTALEAAGAKSISTVMKLIDKSKVQFNEEGNVSSEGIASAIKEIMDSDPILFGEIDPKKAQDGKEFLDPGVKRAGDGSATKTAFQQELQAAIAKGDQKLIAEIGRKYKII